MSKVKRRFHSSNKYKATRVISTYHSPEAFFRFWKKELISTSLRRQKIKRLIDNHTKRFKENIESFFRTHSSEGSSVILGRNYALPSVEMIRQHIMAGGTIMVLDIEGSMINSDIKFQLKMGPESASSLVHENK